MQKSYEDYAICSNMNGPRDCHIERSRSDRERQESCDICYMWNLKKMVEMHIFTKTEKETQV